MPSASAKVPRVNALPVPTKGAPTEPVPLIVKVSVRANPLKVEMLAAETTVFPS